MGYAEWTMMSEAIESYDAWARGMAAAYKAGALEATSEERQRVIFLVRTTIKGKAQQKLLDLIREAV